MRIAFALLLACFSTAQVWARDIERCMGGSGSVTRKTAGFIIIIRPHGDPNKDDAECHAVIRDSNRKAIFSASDYGFSIAPLKQPAESSHSSYVILEGYSGGAHCCWTYYIISLDRPAGLVRKLENDRGAAFSMDEKTGLMEISTMDGAFDYFAFLSHAETPFPDVYLRLEGNKFINESPEHKREYDITINQAKKDLSPSDLQRFRALTNRDALVGENSNRHSASKVLEIVFAYLYSGRRIQAHQALMQMWPAIDRQDIWDMIICTRRQGILRYASREASPPYTPRP
jgi:hypothetical protein